MFFLYLLPCLLLNSSMQYHVSFIRETAVKGTGYVQEGPNSTLTGMAAQLNTGEADICISSTEFLEYRLSAKNGISYLAPTFAIG